MAALRAALADGTIDMVGTDHAPHASHEKDVPWEDAPRGVIGLETAVAAVLGAVALGPADLFARMALAPARLAEVAGRGAVARRRGAGHDHGDRPRSSSGWRSTSSRARPTAPGEGGR